MHSTRHVQRHARETPVTIGFKQQQQPLPTRRLHPQRHCCHSRTAWSRMASCRAAASNASAGPVRVTAPANFEAMCSLLAGCDSSCFRGYVGTWTAYNMQHGSSDAGQSAQAPPPPPAAAAAAAAVTEGGGCVTPVFVDETVNFRLFRVEDPAVPRIHQINMYEGGGRPAAASYASYLTSDASPEGRPDRYGLREWRHDSSGALWSPDCAAWRAEPTTAEKTLVGLAVPDCGLALVNGALPSSFDPQHTPGSWWVEVILKTPGSHARRWGQLLRFDAGRLSNIKAMCEDLTEFGVDQLTSCHIDPGSISWQPRRQGSFGDVEALFAPAGSVNSRQPYGPARTRVSPHGTSTIFTYDEQQQLTMQTGRCSWHSTNSSSGSGGGGGGASGLTDSPDAGCASGCQQDAVVQVNLPDWSYCRVPADISQLADDGNSSSNSSSSSSSREVVFELGTMLADGALARWVLRYAAGGRRLLQSATYELYPAAS